MNNEHVWWRFEIFDKEDNLIRTFDKVLTEDEADWLAHDWAVKNGVSTVWHDKVGNIETPH